MQQRHQRSTCRSAGTRRRTAPAGRCGRRRCRPARSCSGSAASVVRARCSALFTAGTLVSSSSAASVACQRSTSHRISAARCRAGRCCSAVTKASRIVSRASTTSAGSASAGSTRSSAMGETHGASGSCSPELRRVRRPRRPQLHRPGPALAAPEHVQAHVGGDAVQPRPHARSAPRTGRTPSTPAASSPARRPRPRSRSRACGSSSPVSSRRYSSRASGCGARTLPACSSLLAAIRPECNARHRQWSFSRPRGPRPGGFRRAAARPGWAAGAAGWRTAPTARRAPRRGAAVAAADPAG